MSTRTSFPEPTYRSAVERRQVSRDPPRPRLFALALCLNLAIVAAAPLNAQDAAPRDLMRSATSWGYQLQNVEFAKLAATPYDVLVVDAGAGDGSWGLSPRDVARLKRKPDGSRRIVLAYINIGEAEDYRYYWKKSWEKTPPAWMGSANCRWKGDHRVRHWMAEWQDIIFGTRTSYLGRLVAAGYDGVYLDRVDIYYHWRRTRWQAGADMVDFVVRLSQWAKAQRPGFLVVPQNGEELLSAPRYLAAIDAIGKEDMLYGDRGNDTPNAPERVARAQRNFAPARSSGLPVFAIEYAREPGHHADIRARLGALGFTLYLGPRSLAYLGQDGPRHAEDGDTETTASEDGGESCE